MSKKTFTATIVVSVFLVSLVIGMQAVKVAKANPFFIFHEIAPIPGTIPPNITISSPQNNTVYSLDPISVTFHVDKPHLGTCNSAIIDVKYTLDGATTQAFTIWRGGSASNGWAVPEYITTFTSSPLNIGNHSLTVTAEGVVYVVDKDIFFINSSSTTFFEVSTQPTQLNPTPTQTPTLAPTLAPSPSPSLNVTSSPSPSLNPSSALTPSISPSSSPTEQQTGEPITPTPSPSLTPSSSPTQHPTLEQSPTPLDGPYIGEPDLGWIPYAVIAIAIVILAVVFYFKKIKE